MKIVITGASGLVGHAALRAAHKRGHDVIGLYHHHKPQAPAAVRLKQVDLAVEAASIPAILYEYPDAIINAAAISNPASVDNDPDLAEQINVVLPRRLAKIANHLSARLIHLSTDMVFDGKQGHFSPTDTPNPLNLYGQMKLRAEEEVLKYGGDLATVLRIAIVTGNSPSTTRSVHEKLLTALALGTKPALFTNEMRQPNAADNIAAVMVELCERSTLNGIFHWAGAEPISRYEMGRRILHKFNLPAHLIDPVEDTNPNRPHNLTFSLEPLMSKLKTRPTLFADQLEDMHMPPQCQVWYTQILNLPHAKYIPQQRLIQGQDY